MMKLLRSPFPAIKPEQKLKSSGQFASFAGHPNIIQKEKHLSHGFDLCGSYVFKAFSGLPNQPKNKKFTASIYI
jgi:hypothetical protein